MGKASRLKAERREQSTMNVKVKAQAILQVAGRPDIRFQKTPAPEGKISGALVTLLKTEVPDGAPESQFRAALALIVIAWNITVLSADQQPKALRDVLATMKPGDAATRQEAIDILTVLMAKKQALFPDDRRFVETWDMDYRGGNPYITAAALTLSP